MKENNDKKEVKQLKKDVEKLSQELENLRAKNKELVKKLKKKNEQRLEITKEQEQLLSNRLKGMDILNLLSD